MEYYVEKMPKSCLECSYLNLCSLNPNFKPTISKCPLKSLSQHDAEVRKQVIAELEKENKTAVKEFADELNEWAKNIASNSFGAGGSIHYNTFLNKLVELLKERGIE